MIFSALGVLAAGPVGGGLLVVLAIRARVAGAAAGWVLPRIWLRPVIARRALPRRPFLGRAFCITICGGSSSALLCPPIASFFVRNGTYVVEGLVHCGLYCRWVLRRT